MPAAWPSVISIIVPVRDAATTLERAVRSALAQETESELEVILAVAPSRDGTEDVARELARDARVQVVPNPDGTTPAGLNRATRVARGDVIVRLDGHARLPPGYVQTAVSTLVETGAGNVGGRQVPTATSGMAAAVAAAMRSPLGSGGAAYRSGRVARAVETVYLGVFRREALEQVGGFDERLLRNQDYELNHRLRAAGWEVRFDPRLEVAYTPRGSLRALARQYRDYGRYKRLVMTEHPDSIRLRQVAPLALVGGVVVAGVVSGLVRQGWPVAVVGGGYLGTVTIAGIAADARHAPSVASALATMHWAWAIGFLQGPPRS